MVELQKHYMQKAQDKKAEEQLIEHLTWIESEKQWKMREDKWRKEEQARVNLLKNVYDNRLQNVEMKKKIKDENDWLLNNEKEMIDREIERQNREHEERMMKDALYRKKHQGDILMQVNERDRTKRRELQEKMYEERAAKLAEIQYVKKIDTQKIDNHTVLTQMRSQILQ